jgi:hypothetical protein
MSYTNFPNGLTSMGIPVTGPGSSSLIPSLVTSEVFFVNSTSGSDGNSGTSIQRPFETVAKALTVAPAGSVIYLAPGEYDESVVVSTANLTIVGMGGRGAAYIAPSAAGAEAMQVTADDVTLINVGVDGDDTASYGLNVNAASRFRAYGCKFELGGGTGPAVLLDGTADGQVGDAIIADCEFAWAGIGLQADDSGYGYVTQVLVQNCRFHNIATACVGVATSGLFKNLEVIDCFFDNAEDGTAPTDYILLSDNGNTGLFSGNRFATATNDTAVLTIGTGLLWSANATEAGWSTARPA